jgi:hypothetical protein
MLGLGLGINRGSVSEQPALATNAKSMEFGGSNEVIDLYRSSDIMGSGTNLSFSYWVKYTITSQFRIVHPAKGASGSSAIVLGHNRNAAGSTATNYLVIGLFDGVSSFDYVDVEVDDLNDGEWHHIVFTATDGAQVIYVDGQSKVTGTISSWTNSSSTHRMSIGGRNQGGSIADAFAGHADEVGIWTSVLTQAEVTALYENKSLDLNSNSVGYVSSSSLVGWWRMGDGDNDLGHTQIMEVFVQNMAESYSLGAEKVTNGTMEADSDWDDYGSPSTNVQSTEEVKSGTYSRKITGNAGGGINQTFTRSQNIRHYWSVDVYLEDSMTTVRIQTDDQNQIFTGLASDTWHTITFVDESPDPNGLIRVLLQGTGTMFVDNITCKPITNTGSGFGINTEGTDLVSVVP